MNLEMINKRISDLELLRDTYHQRVSAMQQRKEQLAINRASKEKALKAQRVLKLMQNLGITIEDLNVDMTLHPVVRSGYKLPAKYKDPETAYTWSGRGKKPLWLVDHLAAGRTIEEFRVQ